MRFAVIGDTHSNIYALESVFSGLDKQDVDFIVSTGDMVGCCTHPNEVIGYLRKRNVLSVQGNSDRAIAHFEEIYGYDPHEMKYSKKPTEAMLYSHTVINYKNRLYLKNLPLEIKLKTDGLEILILHGSPRSIEEYLYEDSPILDQVTREIKEHVLICGHTHIPYYKVVNGKHIINPGSVGWPRHGKPISTCAIMDIRDGAVGVDILEVPYDFEKSARDIEENEHIPNKYAEKIRTGK
ncbi:MAG: metallophosphoesterase family protein [Clostridiaceae bacterium]